MAAKTTTKTTSKAKPRMPARRGKLGRGAKRVDRGEPTTSKAAKDAGAQSRTDAWMYNPNALTIIETEGHPLFQPRRAFSPPAEWLVQSIMAFGVSEEITVTRGPTINGVQRIEVVDGRQRVKAAREANRRLEALGRPPMLLKAKIVRESVASLLLRMQLANSRVELTPMDLAETAERSLQAGRPEEQVINASFKGNKADFNRHMSLLQCCPEVQSAVEAGHLNLKAVDTLVKLPREDQAAEVARLIEANISGAKAVKAAVEAIHPGIVESNNDAPNEASAAASSAGATGSTPKASGDEDEDEDSGPELRVRGTVVIAQRLADLQALPLPIDIVRRSVLEARISEMKWALGSDDALNDAWEEERGSWWLEEQKRLAEEAARADKKKKRQEARAAKEAERQAKEVAKATREAAKAAKEEEKKAKEVAKAARAAAKGKGPTQAELVV